MLRRITRSVFMQGRGEGYRKLTPEEKLKAEKEFFDKLNHSKGFLPKVRSPLKFLKNLAYTLEPPVPEPKTTSVELPQETIVDNFAWMENEDNYTQLENWLQQEVHYTEANLAKNFHLGQDLLREFRERKPERNNQNLEKGGCKIYVALFIVSKATV